MAKDPVCNMDVDEKKAAKADYKGKTYYFCSPSCQWAFNSNPKQFLSEKNKTEI
ncbi:MAG: YHS domain-containing protein [Nanoarchaeota archaeon]|nr:YHS domain-containing protein [DPANN group archaeon]MBL7116933.1 YHS domain-containing protein [Nanoarchaeota archaeon]